MRKLTIGLVVVLLSSLTMTQAAEYYTKHKGDKRRAEPKEEMALVYIFRPASMGGAIKTWSFADQQLIGVSKPRGYYFDYVSPGKRIVWAKAENTSPLEVELEAGKTYYFKTALRMGWGKARVEMLQIDEAEAETYFEKCSFCELTELGRECGAEIAANRFVRAQNRLAEMKAEAEEDDD